jgi:hypothetical protein
MSKAIITHHHHHGMIHLIIIGISTSQHAAIMCKVSHAFLDSAAMLSAV